MKELIRNIKQLMDARSWKKADVVKAVTDMGMTLSGTSLTNLLDDGKDCKVSQVEKLAKAFRVRPQDLMSVEGFDEKGRPVAAKDAIVADDITFAAENFLKFYLKAVQDKKVSFDDIDYRAFGEAIGEIALARSRAGDFEAQNQIIKCMTRVY